MQDHIVTKSFRKGALTALSFTLAAAFAPAIAGAAPAAITADISKGDVVISGRSMTYTDASGAEQTAPVDSGSSVTITGTTKEHTIKVDTYWASPMNFTFKDLNIDVTNVSNGEGGKVSSCAAYFGSDDDARYNITLEGSNSLKSLDYAGLAIPLGTTVTIDGEGSLTASSVTGNASTSAPAIGAPLSGNNGSVTAIDDKEYRDKNLGTVIINGGTINAAGDSAGIGGSQNGLSGTIVINGGTIKATAGNSSSSGIGCGQDAALGSILITGGTIEATGSNAGAGIGGGGMHTDSGVITILGGDITATGGNYGAGIGGDNNNGAHGDACQIFIGGGTVKAIGGKGAAGIGGGGPEGIADNITITGGDVTAYGGEANASEGDARQRSMVDGKMQMITVGTQTALYGAGAGIGDGGCYATLTNYTSGSNAGTSATNVATRFGGKVKITGGTVRAHSGVLQEEQKAIVDKAGFTYVEAEAIGNGAYAQEGITDDNPYVAVDTAIGGNAEVYANGAAVTVPGKAALKSVTSPKKAQLKATWSKVSSASGYELYVKVAGKKAKTYKVSGASKTVKGLAKGKKATVKVRAVNAAGSGAWSATKSVTIKKK